MHPRLLVSGVTFGFPSTLWLGLWDTHWVKESRTNSTCALSFVVADCLKNTTNKGPKQAKVVVKVCTGQQQRCSDTFSQSGSHCGGQFSSLCWCWNWTWKLHFKIKSRLEELSHTCRKACTWPTLLFLWWKTETMLVPCSQVFRLQKIWEIIVCCLGYQVCGFKQTNIHLWIESARKG